MSYITAPFKILTAIGLLTITTSFEANAKCGGYGKHFSLPDEVSFGTQYRKSLKANFKSHGACVVEEPDDHPVRYGSKSLRFEVRDGDCSWYKDKSGKMIWNDCDEDRFRHELNSYTFQDHTEYWYHWSLYIPTDWVNVYPTKTALGQFHQNGYKPVFMFQNYGGGLSIDRLSDGNSTERVKIIDNEDLIGQWNDILVRAIWSPDYVWSSDDNTEGLFEIWVNGKKVYSHIGQTKNKDKSVYQKFGVYQSFISRYKGKNKTDTIPTQIAYYDAIRVSRDCDGLKLNDLGYDCETILKEVVE